MSAALISPDAGPVVDWTAIVVAFLVLTGVIVTAVFSFLGVRATRATRSTNSTEHYAVIDRLDNLTNTVLEHHRGNGVRFRQLNESIAEIRTAQMRHLEHHLDRDEREGPHVPHVD